MSSFSKQARAAVGVGSEFVAMAALLAGDFDAILPLVKWIVAHARGVNSDNSIC
jgi:hypothetical protein